MTDRVLVLGGTGMLGSAVVRSLREFGLSVVATARDVADAPADLDVPFIAFDADTLDPADLVVGLGHGDVVVNCIGIIKPYIHDDDASERERAIRINSLFPYQLAKFAERQGFRVIQIATDCVYNGAKGAYDEAQLHDATDVYGKSKSLGEVPSPSFLNLRCSVIGPEQKNRTSLLEWVLSHQAGESFSGYTDHIWNGVTGQAFGRIVGGIIASGNDLSGTVHVVPADVVSKDELSRVILTAYGRTGVSVVPTATGTGINRTLSTLRPDVNEGLWRDAGYSTIPTVAELVVDLVRPATPNGEEQ
jgi:dTDP-4-dehydrorhamnose reductase